MKFKDLRPTHCHWTYKIGDYVSFLMYQTPEAARAAMGDKNGTLVVEHGTDCTCGEDS